MEVVCFSASPTLFIGVQAGGAAAPPNFGQLRFFGQQEKFGQSQFLKKLPCFFFEEIYIFSILT